MAEDHFNDDEQFVDAVNGGNGNEDDDDLMDQGLQDENPDDIADDQQLGAGGGAAGGAPGGGAGHGGAPGGGAGGASGGAGLPLIDNHGVEHVLTVCGATAAQRASITSEGFNKMSDFLILQVSDVPTMTNNLTRLSVDRGGSRIGAVLTKKLQGLVYWCHERNRQGKTLDANAFTPTVLMRMVETMALGDGHVAKRAREAQDQLSEKSLPDYPMKQFVQSILGEEKQIPDSDGMTYLENVVNLEAPSYREKKVVIRSITNTVWEKAIELVDDTRVRNRVCVVGTPGVGKSITTAVLIRKLIKRKKTVFYRIARTDPQMIIVTRIKPDGSGNQVQVDTFKVQSLFDIVELHRNSAAYYIVDPGQSRQNCNPPAEILAKVIIVSSPNPTYWGGENFEKQRGNLSGTFVYYPVWSSKEILRAGNYIQPPGSTEPLSEQEICDRYELFGGVPRHIFAKDRAKVTRLIEKQKQAALALTPEQVEWLTAWTSHDLSVENAGTEGQPKSALLVYALDPSSGDCTKCFTTLGSSHVATIIVEKHLKNIWNNMVSLGVNGRLLFESYCRALLSQKSEKNFPARLCVGKSSKERSKILQVNVGGCTSVRLVPDIVCAAKKEPMVLFHPVSSQYPTVDMMYQDRAGFFHAFQVTTGDTHSANENGIQRIANQIGTSNNLTIYYMVPSDRFELFLTFPVEPNAGDCKLLHLMVADPNTEKA